MFPLRWMKLPACAASWFLAAPVTGEEPPAAPVLSRIIPLPGVGGPIERNRIAGRLDHMAYDEATGRLFLAAFAKGSLEIVELDKGVLLRSIDGIPQAQGVAVASALGRVFIASGGDGKVRCFDTKTLAPLGSAFACEDADNVRFDGRGGRVWVGGGSRTAGEVIGFDPATLATVARMSVSAHAESFQLEPTGSRMFINVPGAKAADNDGSITVLECDKQTIAVNWTLTGTARNFPMALDAADNRLFVVARKPPRLLALDAASGKVLGTVPCGADCDDAYFDAKTRRVFLICGGRRVGDGVSEAVEHDQAGSLEVIAIGDRNQIAEVASVALPPHARTGLLVPARRAIYVAVPIQEGKPAELREFRVGD